MKRNLLAAALGALTMLLGLGVLGAAPAPKVVHSASVEAAEADQVEYRFFVPSSGAAFTAQHESELNALGAQGWRVVTPIYTGGILNSYLMMRTKR